MMAAQDSKPVVEVEDLTKFYDGLKAVDNISFRLFSGEILGLLGPNGAGKTTTLQMLLGLTTPTSGEIKIFGLNPESRRAAILQDVNFCASYVSLPYSLTVYENLMVFARLYGVAKGAQKIDELLEIFEIEGIKHKVTRGLSSGQMSRVCLAKSFINDPKIVFLDEPTANLDPDMADKTRTLLKRIKEEKNISILYTSHNMNEMEEMSDRIMFLDKGRILFVGVLEEVLNRFHGRTLEEVFLKIAREE